VNVREAIVSDPRVVQAGASVREAAELLTHPNVRSVLVVDGDRLLGYVTPDAIVTAVAAGVELETATAGEVADGDVVAVGPERPVGEALHLMAEHELERIAVVEDGRFLGVVARGPLLRRLAEDEPAVGGPGGDRTESLGRNGEGDTAA
jgi:CBS domain-containing protein